MKKFSLTMLAFCAVLLPVFAFGGCASSAELEKYKTQNEQLTIENDQLKEDKAELQSQVQDLIAKLESGILCYTLVVDQALSLDLAVEDSFLVVITSNSSYLNFNSQESVLLNIKNWVGGSFVDYDTLASGNYLTPGSGIYEVTVTQIQGAQTASANLVLTNTLAQ